ncbi:unnamed protein product [Lactuca saligna]|uniref:Uncharacterized protein n=1 Tax=Lactuca saligna TaxID=75948 RepID=A0AA35ZA76_LACSI|nr:unnamed protein product [Lactuca saligna]
MLVTKLARYFGVFDELDARFLARIEGHPLQPYLFKTSRIMKDMGNDTYTIPADDTVEVPACRRNMSPRVEDQDPRDTHVGDELPMDPYHVITRKYDDDTGRGMNFIRKEKNGNDRVSSNVSDAAVNKTVHRPPAVTRCPPRLRSSTEAKKSDWSGLDLVGIVQQRRRSDARSSLATPTLTTNVLWRQGVKATRQRRTITRCPLPLVVFNFSGHGGWIRWSRLARTSDMVVAPELRDRRWSPIEDEREV